MQQPDQSQAAPRRVVTGLHSDGRAIVLSDERVPAHFRGSAERPVVLTDLWHIDAVPVSLDSDGTPRSDHPFRIEPSYAGVKFRIVDFPPEDEAASSDERAAIEAFVAMGSADARIEGSRHPAMHRTSTIDFGIVLQGNITMLLDDEDVELQTGDIVIQRATAHAWVNRSGEPCRMAFVLIDGEE